MFKSTLIEILKTLSAKEIKEFSDMVNSPFFNKNENVKRLFDYLKKYHPAFDNRNIQKEVIHKKVFGDEKYNDAFMRKTIYNMQNLAEDYLNYSYFKKNNSQYSLNSAKALLAKGHYKLFEKKISELELILNNTVCRDENYAQLMYDVEHIKDEYYINYSVNQFSTYEHLKKKNSVPYMSKPLILNFLLRIMAEFAYTLTQQTRVKIDYNFPFLDEVLSFLKNSEYLKENPQLNIHYLEFLLMRFKKDEYFYQLKNALFKDFDKLIPEVRYSADTILQTYCIYKFSSGFSDFIIESFELNKLSLKLNIQLQSEQEYLSDNNFLSIIETAVLANEFEWMENFIILYKDRLSPEVRQDVYNYSMGRLCFGNKKYEDALVYFSKMERFSNIEYKMRTRLCTMIIYFELGWDEQFFSAVDAYNHFLSTNKLVSEQRKRSLQVFVKYIMKLKKNPDKFELKKLKKEFESKEMIAGCYWLLEKVNKALAVNS